MKNATFILFWPDAKNLKQNGFAKISHVPCVFNGEWQYQQVPSLYLRHRALGMVKTIQYAVQIRRGRYPTKASMKAYGAAVTNFLEWCGATGRRWQAVSYVDDVLHGYQNHMNSGQWSARNVPLSAHTVNARVDEACRFLSWASARELREAFNVVTTRMAVSADSGTYTRGHKLKVVEARVGSVRPNPVTLRIPTDAEVVAWHSSVFVRSGLTKALMCELVLATAIRREETVQWRVDTLPIDRESWNIVGDEVKVKIKYGTKGAKTEDVHGEEVGPERTICIPLSVALDLDRYRKFVRPKLLAKFVRAATTDKEKRRRIAAGSNRLFLSDSTGEPVSAQRFYEAWAQAPRRPFEGWAPHLGRNWWACKQLLLSCERRVKTASSGGAFGDEHGIVVSTAMDVIMMEIKPQLGHVSEETTQKYLVWIHSIYKLKTLHDDYGSALENVACIFEANVNG